MMHVSHQEHLVLVTVPSVWWLLPHFMSLVLCALQLPAWTLLPVDLLCGPWDPPAVR